MPKIRRAAPGDLESLVPLWHSLQEVQRSLRPFEQVNENEYFKNEFSSTVSDEEHVWLVVESDDGVICAMAHLYTERPSSLATWPVLAISRVSVLPSAKHEGIGRMIIEEADRIARERGINHLSAKIFARNTEALPFWDAMEFEPYVDIRLRPVRKPPEKLR
ncbi:MAG: GNAT family N-acetyltransferase [Actinomycetota bacterium]